MLVTVYDRRVRLAHAANDAARVLSDLTEWSAAGQMLRVSSILHEREHPKIALSFALGARADSLNYEGIITCTMIIRDLEKLMADWPKTTITRTEQSRQAPRR